MKIKIAMLIMSVLLATLAGNCGAKEKSGGKGNPEMVAAIAEIAELGCACKDKQCLFAAQIRGKSIVQWRMASTAQMTAEEKKASNASWRKYTECEAQKK